MKIDSELTKQILNGEIVKFRSQRRRAPVGPDQIVYLALKEDAYAEVIRIIEAIENATLLKEEEQCEQITNQKE